jgi:hypothetical protein
MRYNILIDKFNYNRGLYMIAYWRMTGFLITLVITPTWAATVVKHHGTKQGKEQTVLIEGNKARMESGAGQGYTLINMENKKVYMVDERNKRVIKMGVGEELPPIPADLPKRDKRQAPPEVDAKLVKVDDGPEILHYPTQHYQVVANGVICSDEYFSKAARQVVGLDDFIKVLAELSQDRKQKMGAMPLPVVRDPCMQAQEKLEQELNQLGVPMRSVDKKGRVVTEIISIETDVPVDASKFELPKDYPVLTEKQVIQTMETEMRQQSVDPRLESEQKPQDTPPQQQYFDTQSPPPPPKVLDPQHQYPAPHPRANMPDAPQYRPMDEK